MCTCEEYTPSTHVLWASAPTCVHMVCGSDMCAFTHVQVVHEHMCVCTLHVSVLCMVCVHTPHRDLYCVLLSSVWVATLDLGLVRRWTWDERGGRGCVPSPLCTPAPQGPVLGGQSCLLLQHTPAPTSALVGAALVAEGGSPRLYSSLCPASRL